MTGNIWHGVTFVVHSSVHRTPVSHSAPSSCQLSCVSASLARFTFRYSCTQRDSAQGTLPCLLPTTSTQNEWVRYSTQYRKWWLSNKVVLRTASSSTPVCQDSGVQRDSRRYALGRCARHVSLRESSAACTPASCLRSPALGVACLVVVAAALPLGARYCTVSQ